MIESSHGSSEAGNSLWQQAAAMAAMAHLGQTSPGEDTPYFAHPSRVAMLVASQFRCFDPEVIAAAYLHDVFEKTSLTREAVALTLGGTVAGWVEWLSKSSKDEKETYWKRLSEAPWQARLIKMADALDHLHGPPEYRDSRLRAARRALKLATGDEAAIHRAAAILEAEIRHMEE
ncbi:HD domain-containing protein [Luteolibacter soli]|uniref:HD domain-containing protein n=1 Tax=Luteolibacter soli TaxID=3135280 RepID=A0ABU9B1N7_9BACT